MVPHKNTFTYAEFRSKAFSKCKKLITNATCESRWVPANCFLPFFSPLNMLLVQLMHSASNTERKQHMINVQKQ